MMCPTLSCFQSEKSSRPAALWLLREAELSVSFNLCVSSHHEYCTRMSTEKSFIAYVSILQGSARPQLARPDIPAGPNPHHYNGQPRPHYIQHYGVSHRKVASVGSGYSHPYVGHHTGNTARRTWSKEGNGQPMDGDDSSSLSQLASSYPGNVMAGRLGDGPFGQQRELNAIQHSARVAWRPDAAVAGRSDVPGGPYRISPRSQTVAPYPAAYGREPLSFSRIPVTAPGAAQPYSARPVPSNPQSQEMVDVVEAQPSLLREQYSAVQDWLPPYARQTRHDSAPTTAQDRYPDMD
jgi:hypothetical protein